jgi:hypothetical protein
VQKVKYVHSEPQSVATILENNHLFSLALREEDDQNGSDMWGWLEGNNFAFGQLISSVSLYIQDAPKNLEEEGIDIRLQVFEGWKLHHGLADYDQDHRGYWGASGYDSSSDPVAIAEDLVDQVLEVYASDFF